MPTVAFQTSCYQKSYKHLLVEDTLSHYLSLFDEETFAEKNVIINNMTNYSEIKALAQKREDINFLYSYRAPDTILRKFNLSLEDFAIGLHYSIQHFTGIFYTNCDYIFHVSEDCGIDNLDSNFIKESIEMLESNEKYIIAMPRCKLWFKDINDSTSFEDAIERTEPDRGNFSIQYSFTDQIYIIKTKKFKEDIYHYKHPMSDRYPAYGGECFEKRVDSFMRCNQYYGIVHRDYIYDNIYYDSIIKKGN